MGKETLSEIFPKVEPASGCPESELEIYRRLLEEAQTRILALEGILENDLVLVRGGIGTGKTLLARELAVRGELRDRRPAS